MTESFLAPFFAGVLPELNLRTAVPTEGLAEVLVVPRPDESTVEAFDEVLAALTLPTAAPASESSPQPLPPPQAALPKLPELPHLVLPPAPIEVVVPAAEPAIEMAAPEPVPAPLADDPLAPSDDEPPAVPLIGSGIALPLPVVPPAAPPMPEPIGPTVPTPKTASILVRAAPDALPPPTALPVQPKADRIPDAPPQPEAPPHPAAAQLQPSPTGPSAAPTPPPKAIVPDQLFPKPPSDAEQTDDGHPDTPPVGTPQPSALPPPQRAKPRLTSPSQPTAAPTAPPESLTRPEAPTQMTEPPAPDIIVTSAQPAQTPNDSLQPQIPLQADAPVLRTHAAPHSRETHVQPPTQHATHILSQIDAAVTRSDGGTIEITFSPSELGRVTIRLDAAPNEARIIIAAERPETLALLKTHQADLATSLANGGYSTVDMTFSDSPRQFAGQQPQTEIPYTDDPPDAATPTWPRAKPIPTTGRYDRRI